MDVYTAVRRLVFTDGDMTGATEATKPAGTTSDTAQMLTIRIPLHVRKRGGRKTMIALNLRTMPAHQDVTLVKALAPTFR